MPSTSVYALRYQTVTEAPNGATLGQNLAEDVEAELVRIDAAAAARIPVKASVAASQSTASTTYVDLATVGPAVTIAHGTTVKVHISAAQNSLAGGFAMYMGVAVSGANTIAANDTDALHQWDTSTGVGKNGITLLFTGLTPGTSTFTAKYRVGSGSAQWATRQMIVEAY